MLFDQIAVLCEVHAADLLLTGSNIQIGLDRDPLIPADKLIRHIILIVFCIFAAEQRFRAEFRSLGQQSVLGR